MGFKTRLVLLFFCAFFFVVGANPLLGLTLPPCAVQILQASPESPEFLRFAVRDPSEPLFDTAYLTRLQASLQDVFLPWFVNPQRLQSFQDMLRSQHVILTAGRGGGEVYNGASGREHGKTSTYVVVPGKFRHELSPPEQGVSLGIRWDKHLGKDMSPRLLNMIGQYVGRRSAQTPAEPTGKWTFDMPFRSSEIEVLSLPRLEGRLYEWNEIYEQYLYHYYFKAKYVPVVLEAMAEVMKDLHALYHQGDHDSPESLNRFLHYLSEYIYLGIHGHVFNGANFSLVMGQANLLLTLWNLQGISHSNLDYVALSRPLAEFEERYRRDVAAINAADSRMHAILSAADRFAVPIQLNFLIHVADVGDELYGPNVFLGSKEGEKRIEAISITPVGLPAGTTLKYFAHLTHLGDTPWYPAGSFVGTRGESRAIEGLAIKLEGPNASDFDLTYQVRVEGIGMMPQCRDGEFCGTRGESRPITGLLISLTKKPGRT